jgi:uncharacterized protein (DUF58 family)
VRSTSFRPTRRAVAFAGGALLLFGVGTNVQAGWVLVVAALLIGILVAGVVLPLRGLRGISVARRTPRTATAGEPLPVTLDVSNTSRHARALFRVSDEFCGSAYAVVGAVGPGQTRSYEANRDGARRGIHETGPCRLETGAPFGMISVRRDVLVASPTVVYPKVYDARAWRLRGPSGWPAPASVGDVSSVRDYRPGDPLRHIHWRSVARRGQLVVREFDREVQASVVVLSDVPTDPDTADAVASVASSIAIAALRDGDVSVGGRRVRAADAVLDWGARLRPDFEPSGALLEGTERADAIVYVGTPALAPVERLRSTALATSVTVVLIGGGGADAAADAAADATIAGALRASGATVDMIRCDEVEPWLTSASIAS